MSIDADLVRNLIALSSLIISLCAFVFARQDKNSEGQNKALDRIENNLRTKMHSIESTGDERHEANTTAFGNIVSRLTGIEERVTHVPTARDMDQLQLSISLVAQSVAELKGTAGATGRTLELINKYLMERGT